MTMALDHGAVNGANLVTGGSAPIKILGISGSLRAGSFNTRLLRAIQVAALDLADIEIFSINQIPSFDDDVLLDGFPPEVTRLRRSIEQSDAVLFAVPEYNRSFPGVLKNALDWISRPPNQPLEEKVVAVVGASPGFTGAARGQMHFRQCLFGVNADQVVSPEILVGNAESAFEANGQLVDVRTAELVRELIRAMARRVVRRGAVEARASV